MTSFSDHVYESLLISEGFVSTIYKDGKGIPTIGMGLALVLPSSGVYSVRNDIENIIERYLEDNISLRPSILSALQDAADALNNVSGATNPFVAGYILQQNPTRLQQEIAKYGSVGTAADFKTNFWEGNGNIFNKYLSSTISAVGSNKWDKLTDNEKTAIYSLVYNGGAGIIGSGMDHAINLMTAGGTLSTADKNSFSDSQYIGYIQFINEILYRSNPEINSSGSPIPNRDGIQNRRFFEANEAIGNSLSSMPTASNAAFLFPATNLRQAQIAIAFLNANISTIYYKIAGIDGYKFADSGKNPYSFIQSNAKEAYELILENENYISMREELKIPNGKFAPEYNIESLFTGWNLYTDLCLTQNGNQFTGETYYRLPSLSTNSDMFIMSQSNFGEGASRFLDAKNGDDYINTSSLAVGEMFTADLGEGYDTYIGGEANDIVDGGSNEDNAYAYNRIKLGGGSNTYTGTKGVDVVWTQSSNNNGETNNITLGAGSDIFYGGNANDTVDGGTGYFEGATEDQIRNSQDSTNDTNLIYLGGGSDTYVAGKKEGMLENISYGDGNDIIFGGSYSEDDGIIRDENGKVTSWSDHDVASSVNKIYLGRGDDEYYGTRGTDIVDASGSISANTKNVYLGNGDDQYICGSSADIVHTGNGNNTITGVSYNDEIYLGSGTNTITTKGGGTINFAAGGTNYINAEHGFELSGKFETANITITPRPGHETVRFEKQGDDLYVLYFGNQFTLKDYYLDTSAGLPIINGYRISPYDVLERENNEFVYLLGDMNEEKPSDIINNDQTLNACGLLIQSMSSFAPQSAATMDLIDQESWKAPEIYSSSLMSKSANHMA